MKKKYHVNVSFKWFDLWMGVFVDFPANSIYICLLPMIPIKIWFTEHEICPMCEIETAMEKTAYLDADGWILEWECPECSYNTEDGFPWPFGEETKSAKELEHFGFKVL